MCSTVSVARCQQRIGKVSTKLKKRKQQQQQPHTTKYDRNEWKNVINSKKNCVSHIIQNGIRYCHIIFVSFFLFYTFLCSFFYPSYFNHFHFIGKTMAAKKKWMFAKIVCYFVTSWNAETEQMHDTHNHLCSVYSPFPGYARAIAKKNNKNTKLVYERRWTTHIERYTFRSNYY